MNIDLCVSLCVCACACADAYIYIYTHKHMNMSVLVCMEYARYISNMISHILHAKYVILYLQLASAAAATALQRMSTEPLDPPHDDPGLYAIYINKKNLCV